MRYIITKNKAYFEKIGNYNYCSLEDMVLPETIAVDSETTGLFARKDNMFCLQVGTGDNGYIIDFYTSPDSYKFEDVIPYLKDKILVGHNILFDLGFFYKHNFYPKRVRDTMLASKVLYNGQFKLYDTKKGRAMLPIKHDFGSVMASELGVKYDKTDQKNIHIVKLSQPSTIEYSFNDVDRLLELHTALKKKIDSRGYIETYKLHCQYIRALAYMEQCGFGLSSEAWMAKMIVDKQNAKNWKQKVEEYIYDNLPKYADRQYDMFDEEKRIKVSLTSPIQMIKVFNDFGIPTKDKDGNDSIGEDIISKSKHEFVKLWLDFQGANHRVTTFGQKIYDQIENERVYTNFNPMVDTARLSSRKGSINFLNFPSDKETRDCFKCKPGNVMIVCDWSGQETVIAADLSGDKAMTKSVLEGSCLHSAFARILFPELTDLSDEVIQTEHKAKRQAAKSPRFAFQYGGSAFTIHQNEGIPLDEAYKIEAAFKELHEGLYTWGDKVFKEAVDKGYIESADGWKLRLPKFDLYLKYKENIESITKEEWSLYKIGKGESKAEFEAKEKKETYTIINKEAYNYYKSKAKEVSQYFKLQGEYKRLCLNNPVQARGAHQLKRATVLLFNWILENNLQGIVLLCNSIHDEMVLECPEEYGQIACDKLSECMITGGNYYLKNLEIKADAHTGASWYEAK